jgi:hypothetical protein
MAPRPTAAGSFEEVAMDEDNVVPELLAYRERDRWRAHCEFCNTFHVFRDLGRQPAKCPEYTPYVETGVMLVDGGVYRRQRVVKFLDRRI